jgi:hypothetical protein
MRTRKRNWIGTGILKQATLGFSVVALVLPAGAQAARGGEVNAQSNWTYKVTKSDRFVPGVTSSSGFDWGDAGVGAGVVLGLGVFGGAALHVRRKLGKAQTA